jgi:hypothetical protein
MLSDCYLSYGEDTLEIDPGCYHINRLYYMDALYDNVAAYSFLDFFEDHKIQERSVSCTIIKLNTVFQISINFSDSQPSPPKSGTLRPSCRA